MSIYTQGGTHGFSWNAARSGLVAGFCDQNLGLFRRTLESCCSPVFPSLAEKSISQNGSSPACPLTLVTEVSGYSGSPMRPQASLPKSLALAHLGSRHLDEVNAIDQNSRGKRARLNVISRTLRPAVAVGLESASLHRCDVVKKVLVSKVLFVDHVADGAASHQPLTDPYRFFSR